MNLRLDYETLKKRLRYQGNAYSGGIMGYSIGDRNGRDIGYGVLAICQYRPFHDGERTISEQELKELLK